MFYKKIDNNLQSANAIHSPDGIWTEENKEDAPDGWKWFDTFEAACSYFAMGDNTVSRKQLKLALLQTLDLDTVEAVIAVQSREVQIEWNEAGYAERNNPALLAMITYLATVDSKWTPAYVDSIFEIAKSK